MGLQVPDKISRSVKGWFGSHRIQETLLLTFDGRLRVLDVPVEKLYAVDDGIQMAWELDGINQIRNKQSKNLTQVVWEGDAKPLAISGQENPNLGAVRGAIALRSFWDVLYKIEKNAKRNLMLWAIMIIGGIIAIGFVGMLWMNMRGR
jgi:hypothetical protein